ncbi:hypothetical protein F5148DRAFT_1286335 [Russula earlei]|uniref:Uncharacterized protein n=1 Tax=Russula earlei TaxID=71964 RepID=A0ACC0U657_9AGAM|nr:hypothetical protein F5148DRAFT_1286335 [Russula earlei]
MTNEELASLEPIIAQAWDQWDHQRRLHYAQQAQAAAGAGRPPDGQPLGEVAPPPPPHSPHSIIAPTSLVPASIVVPAPSSASSAPSPVTSATVSAPAATVVLVSRDTSIAAPLLSKEFKKVQTRAKPGAATEKQTLPPHRQPRRRR